MIISKKEILIFNLRSTPIALKIRSAEDLFGDEAEPSGKKKPTKKTRGPFGAKKPKADQFELPDCVKRRTVDHSKAFKWGEDLVPFIPFVFKHLRSLVRSGKNAGNHRVSMQCI